MFSRSQTVVAKETAELRRDLRARVKRFGLRSSRFAFLVGAFVTAFAAASAAEENYQVAHGLGVYLGVVPAGIVRGHLDSHPEGAMHGGAPRGKHQYSMVVAIFDANTGARIENARVAANILGLGHVGIQNVELESMLIAGTVTYGNFVKLPGNDRELNGLTECGLRTLAIRRRVRQPNSDQHDTCCNSLVSNEYKFLFENAI